MSNNVPNRKGWLSSRSRVLSGFTAVMMLSLVSLFVFCLSGQGSCNILPWMDNLPSWRSTMQSKRHALGQPGAAYFRFRTMNTTVNLVVVDLKSGNWQIKPAINPVTAPTSLCARAHGAMAAVNGGFFDFNGDSVSFVVVDEKLVVNPEDDRLLMRNRSMRPYLKEILNRSELRILTDGHQVKAVICRHYDPTPKGWRVSQSIQGGPGLLPVVGSKQECFVRRDGHGVWNDAIRSNAPAARTAVGITPDGNVLILCAEGPEQGGKSRGLSLGELAQLLKGLGCSEALNLDGGSSSTMYVRAPGGPAGGQVVCGKRQETDVKSVLLVLPRYR